MFIKLTKQDGSPIWLNAAFVVTVEPRRGGGAVVVPVGDGLDYDVREAPEKVLSLLGDAPAPAILPIPTTDALTPTPEDVSSESVAQLVTEARQSPDARPSSASPKEYAKPVIKVSARPPDPSVEASGEPKPAESEKSAEPEAATEPGAKAASAEETASEVESVAKPAKRTRKTATAATKKPRTTRKKKPALPIPEDQVERLKKMGPKSVKKLQNTLATQFRVEDAEAAVQALEANGVFTLDGDRVVWGSGE